MVVVEPAVPDSPAPLPAEPPVMIAKPAPAPKKWVDASYASQTLLLDGAAFAMAVDALVLAKERIPEERAYFRDDARRTEERGTRASASSARPASAHP